MSSVFCPGEPSQAFSVHSVVKNPLIRISNDPVWFDLLLKRSIPPVDDVLTSVSCLFLLPLFLLLHLYLSVSFMGIFNFLLTFSDLPSASPSLPSLLPSLIPYCHPLLSTLLPPLPHLFHYQISACVSGLNTWNMSQRSVMASHQTSSTPWSDSLSCSVKPTRCSAPETWDLSSATSSSQTWTTWRPSGPTTWMEICWKPSSWSSSATPWGWQQGRRRFACWSAWTRMTMRKAEGCFGLLAVGEGCRNLVTETTDRLTGQFKQILSGVRCKPRRMKWSKCYFKIDYSQTGSTFQAPCLGAIPLKATRWQHVPSLCVPPDGP